MTFRQYVLVMSLASATAWAGWALVLVLIDPLTTGVIGLGLFYASLSSALIGTLALAGILIRVALFRRDIILSREVGTAFRQSVLATLLIIGSLILQRFSLLTWWSTLLLLAVCGCTELFLLMNRPTRHPLSGTQQM